MRFFKRPSLLISLGMVIAGIAVSVAYFSWTYAVGQPTRWAWHGPPPSMFAEKAWIIVPVDMKFYGSRSK